ncbi:MAG: hypothetical protein AAB790_02525 [Patescibacteria group bacterium]
MPRMTTAILLAALIFVSGLVAIFEQQLLASGVVTHFFLHSIPQVTFAALIMVAVRRYQDECRIAANIPLNFATAFAEFIRLVCVFSFVVIIGLVFRTSAGPDKTELVMTVILLSVAGALVGFLFRAAESRLTKWTAIEFQENAVRGAKLADSR